MNIKELEKIHNAENRMWRNPITYRTTNTGMSKNVISTYAPYNNYSEIILHLKAEIIPYIDGRKLLDKEDPRYNQYFKDVVNECLRNVYHGKKGYVFSESQLREVVQILPSVCVTYSKTDGCYWCRK